jgi:hypothetical protein
MIMYSFAAVYLALPNAELVYCRYFLNCFPLFKVSALVDIPESRLTITIIVERKATKSDKNE